MSPASWNRGACSKFFPFHSVPALTEGQVNPTYVNVLNINIEAVMELAAKMDHYGKPAWIVAMVLGFIVFWPIGLMILAYLIWSGRMGFWRDCARRGRWYYTEPDKSREKRHAGPTSGNHAFDEYREETLRRMEEEQEAFKAFLERLRQAKDKTEFDQFMADRGADRGRRQGMGPEAGEGAAS